MSLPPDLVRQVRELDEPELRRLLILARGLLIGSPGPVVALDDVPGVPEVRYVQKRVRCGRRCQQCPHGPYWYASWREDGRARTLYIGRELPADVRRIVEEARRARDAASPATPDDRAGGADVELLRRPRRGDGARGTCAEPTGTSTSARTI